jgi:hypothetical protein
MSEHRLNEIVIERPRHGRRISLKKVTGYRKTLDKITQEAVTDGLFQPYLIKPRNKTKSLNDNLNPLRNLLRSRLGQPWNQVHSELSRRLDSNSMTGRHVLDHVRDYVTLNVEFINDVPYSRDARWRRFRALGSGYHGDFYVHPETGILCLAAKRSRVSVRIVPQDWIEPKHSIRIDRYHRYERIDDVWYWVTFADLPVNQPIWDVVEKRTVQSNHPGNRYATEKRQCNKRELKGLRDRYPGQIV